MPRRSEASRQGGALSTTGHLTGSPVEPANGKGMGLLRQWTLATPISIRSAAGIVAGEGIAFFAAAVFYVVETIFATPTRLFGALGGAVLAIGMCAALLFLSRGLVELKRWARSPIVVIQLLALPVGFSLTFQAARPWPGAPLLIVALTVLGFLATPSARQALTPE